MEWCLLSTAPLGLRRVYRAWPRAECRITDWRGFVHNPSPGKQGRASALPPRGRAGPWTSSSSFQMSGLGVQQNPPRSLQLSPSAPLASVITVALPWP